MSCEALLGALERHIAAPDAMPARIVEIVSSMPSTTVPAPRSLPGKLVDRLEEIASQHGGKVPFHGRLFAQWLHHAYPRECPYPQLSGTAKPVTQREWKERTGKSAGATKKPCSSTSRRCGCRMGQWDLPAPPVRTGARWSCSGAPR